MQREVRGKVTRHTLVWYQIQYVLCLVTQQNLETCSGKNFDKTFDKPIDSKEPH